MKSQKTLRLFEAISKYDVYSKYNSELEKKFKDRSLKSFIYSLRHSKKKEKASFLEEFYKKYPYDFEGKNIIKNDNKTFCKFNDSLNKKEEKEVKEAKEAKSKNNSPQKNDKDERFSFTSKKYYDIDLPDPFKYSPNYDFVLKKIPSFKISPKKDKIQNLKKIKLIKENNKIKNNKKILIYNNITEDEKEEIKNKTNQFIRSKSNKSNIKNNDKLQLNLKRKNIDLPLITSSNIIQTLQNESKDNNRNNTINASDRRDNHALRFSKYLARKIILNSTNGQVSYIEPYDYELYNKNAIDFRKMQSRNKKGIVNVPSLDIPPIGKYYPKYSLVESNAKNVLFSPFGENKNNKKVKLHKMLGSYKVFQDYQSIDNDKLFNDNDLIYKQLIINYNLNP